MKIKFEFDFNKETARDDYVSEGEGAARNQVLQ